MADRLLLGTRRYSSWSMRGWLLVRLAGLDVEEVVVPLNGAGDPSAVAGLSPSGLVPFLQHDGHEVWDSLAIAEYCAELKPGLWPAELGARTHARVISAEMHSGFRALRGAMPMNLGRHRPGACQTPDALADIARIETLWRNAQAQYGAGGPYLFGAAFNAADAMFAPVVARLLTYEPPLSDEARAYCGAVRAHPLVEEWYAAAAQEPREWLLDKYENA